VITITSVSGNIFGGAKCMIPAGYFERLRVSRQDLERARMRKRTDQGTDVGLVLRQGEFLRHGDVLRDSGRTIIVEQIPEKIIRVRVADGDADTMAVAGHIIGNRHRPISVRDGTITFPIQADSEADVFRTLFSEIIGDIEMSVGEEVFVPHRGADVHDHR